MAVDRAAAPTRNLGCGTPVHRAAAAPLGLRDRSDVEAHR